MLFPPIDPNERFRERRAAVRRRKRLRRGAAVGACCSRFCSSAWARSSSGRSERGARHGPRDAGRRRRRSGRPATLPIELRGVHVTMGLASLPGKLDEYLELERDGLTALELDVKDENGEIGFITRARCRSPSRSAPRVTTTTRADAVRRVHERGVYSIGRIVVFEDPVLSRARPDLAIRRPTARSGVTPRASAGRTRTTGACGSTTSTSPIAAARAGFDEIMFDYVRFPSDGDVTRPCTATSGSLEKREAVPAFLRYAKSRLEPYGVRVSAAVFGLSAARDLGIGQLPRQMAPHLDTVYAMTYPSLFGAGELGLAGSERGARRDRLAGAASVRARAPRPRRSRRALGAGLQLLRPVRPRGGAGPDRRGADLGREGLHALERRGPVHGRRARAALVATARGARCASPSSRA